MRNTITKKPIVRNTLLLLAMLLLSGCTSAAINEDNQTLSAPKPTLAKVDPTRPIPNPTNPPAPATITPSPAPFDTYAQSHINKAGFRVCAYESLVIPNQDLPASGDGLSMSLDSLIPPAPPANIAVATTQEGVKITWQGTGTDVDESYIVYQLAGGDDCWEIISIVPIKGDNTGVYEFHATLSGEALAHSFGISTMDIYGNESSLSITASVAGT